MTNLTKSIDLVEANINNGVVAFFVETNGVGKIAIETVNEGFDPLDPIECYKWEEAPATDWVLFNKRIQEADYYVRLGVTTGYGSYMRHILSVAAISAAILKRLEKDAPMRFSYRESIDTAVLLYLSNVEKIRPRAEDLTEEFLRNFSLLSRGNALIRAMANENIQNRLNRANEIMNEISAGTGKKRSNGQYALDLMQLAYMRSAS